MSGEIGIGYNTEPNFCLSRPCARGADYLIVPNRIGLLWGRRRRFFELGVVNALVLNRPDDDAFLHQFVFGFRAVARRKHKGHFRLVAQVPFPNFETGNFFPFPLGISIGAGLK